MNKIKKEEGQSTIEFLSTFAFAFALMFLFIKIAMNFTDGYLVQYANFMASRSYLVTDTNQAPASTASAALNRARQVFNIYKVNVFIPTFNGVLQANSPLGSTLPFYTGTYVEYNDKFSFSKLMGGAADMTFRAESFLGKEPMRRECGARVCKAFERAGGACTAYTTVFDNGC
jgi:hypothetical protein